MRKCRRLERNHSGLGQYGLELWPCRCRPPPGGLSTRRCRKRFEGGEDTELPGHWEAHGFSRLFEVRVFKRHGKLLVVLDTGNPQDVGSGGRRPFCEFGGNLDYMPRPCFPNKQAATGKTAQLAKCLLCDCVHLGLISRTRIRKSGMAVHASNPRTAEAETGRSLELTGQSTRLLGEASGQRETLPSNKVDSA